MEISFKNERLKKLCEDYQSLCKKYGDNQAEKIIQRIKELQAFENLYDASKLPQIKLHPLKGNYSGCFAVSLIQPYRIIFEPQDGNVVDYKTITKIKIIESRIDYH